MMSQPANLNRPLLPIVIGIAVNRWDPKDGTVLHEKKFGLRWGIEEEEAIVEHQIIKDDDDQSSDDDDNDENINGKSTPVGVYTGNHSSIAIPYLDHTEESPEELRKYPNISIKMVRENIKGLHHNTPSYRKAQKGRRKAFKMMCGDFENSFKALPACMTALQSFNPGTVVEWEHDSTTIQVGNIPYDATEEQLIQICEEVGPVVSFRLVIDRETGKPKGYGFCEYKDEETALSARRNLQGYDINGRQLRVDFAENDKNSDRNRDQGRGGPGMVANADPKKHIGGPAVPVDSALHQPLGMPVAMTAAAVMAGALGAGQTGSSFSQSGVDPLTLHMSKFSRNQLNDVMSEFKAMCTQNKEQTRQLLLAIPNLSKALFQLQTPNIRQSAAPQLQPMLLDGQQSQQLATQSLPGLPPLPPNLLPQVRPPIQLAQPGQNQVLQSLLPTPSRILPPMQPQVNVSINPPVQMGTSSAVKQKMQSSFLQQAGPVASTDFTYNNQLGTANASYPPPPSMRPPLLEQGFQGIPSVVSGVLDNTNTDSRRPQAPNSSSLITRPAYPSGLSEEKKGAANNLDLLSRPSKITRLNDGISYALPDASVSTPHSGPSTQVPVAAEVSNPDKQASQIAKLVLPMQSGRILDVNTLNAFIYLVTEAADCFDLVQLPSDIESALLQQVLSLTPEQLSSLPPDQQQQVIQLQQMLRQPT
ncbi:putative cathepsin B-like [Capsicum annuum]|nr:putative cathepsin B-like [Capsicum annuum]